MVLLANKVKEKIDKMVMNQATFDENDSLRIKWIRLSEITLQNSSPLVVKAKNC